MSSWQRLPATNNVHKVRKTTNQNPDGWRTQVHAVALLADVQRFVATLKLAGEPTEYYERWIPKWAFALFMPDRQWSANPPQNGETAFDQSLIDMLNALADRIDSTGIGVQLSTESTQSSIDALDEIVAALKSPDVNLNEVERRYIFELINSCRTVFQEADAIGPVDLLRRVHELLGVMTMLAETLAKDPVTEGVAKRILRASRKVVPYVAFGAKVTAGTLGATADLLQITSG